MDLAYYPIEMYDDDVTAQWSYDGWYAIESAELGGVIMLVASEAIAAYVLQALEGGA